MGQMKSRELSRDERVVVVSDTHFGDSTELLIDCDLIEEFASVLEGGKRVSELILLGDILDLWVKTTIPAMRKARAFIERITQVKNLKRILYIPGNHDHQMFLDAFRLEQDIKIMRGDLSAPRFEPVREYGETLLSALSSRRSGVAFYMVYPFIVREVEGTKIVLTHGHHLDFYASEFGWAKTFWLGRHIIKKRRKKATLHDIEMANIPFCGAMSAAAWVPELVAEGLKYYHVISFFAKILHSRRVSVSPLRDTLIRESYDEIEGLIPLFGVPGARGFVFGHTHRPGMGWIPDKDILVVNTGSWTKGDEGVPTKTWVEIEGDGRIRLFSLDKGEIESGSVIKEGS